MSLLPALNAVIGQLTVTLLSRTADLMLICNNEHPMKD
jgi:hypothetical protein